jgi:hypothetical protein
MPKLADKFFKAPQSKLAGYSYLAVVAYITLLTVYRRQSLLMASVVPITFSTLFTMYTLNCMVYGKCTVYAWLSVILTVLSLLATVVSVTGASMFSKSSKSKNSLK